MDESESAVSAGSSASSQHEASCDARPGRPDPPSQVSTPRYRQPSDDPRDYVCSRPRACLQTAGMPQPQIQECGVAGAATEHHTTESEAQMHASSRASACTPTCLTQPAVTLAAPAGIQGSERLRRRICRVMSAKAVTGTGTTRSRDIAMHLPIHPYTLPSLAMRRGHNRPWTDKSASTWRRQGQRPGKRQRAEEQERTRMQRQDQNALLCTLTTSPPRRLELTTLCKTEETTLDAGDAPATSSSSTWPGVAKPADSLSTPLGRTKNESPALAAEHNTTLQPDSNVGTVDDAAPPVASCAMLGQDRATTCNSAGSTTSSDELIKEEDPRIRIPPTPPRPRRKRKQHTSSTLEELLPDREDSLGSDDTATSSTSATTQGVRRVSELRRRLQEVFAKHSAAQNTVRSACHCATSRWYQSVRPDPITAPQVPRPCDCGHLSPSDCQRRACRQQFYVACSVISLRQDRVTSLCAYVDSQRHTCTSVTQSLAPCCDPACAVDVYEGCQGSAGRSHWDWFSLTWARTAWTILGLLVASGTKARQGTVVERSSATEASHLPTDCAVSQCGGTRSQANSSLDEPSVGSSARLQHSQVVAPKPSESANRNPPHIRAELGPKSQRRGHTSSCMLLTLLLLLNQVTMVASGGTGPAKPRVVVVTAAAAGVPGYEESHSQQQGTKACGAGPQGQHRHIRKISLRKATNTAQRAGIAQYRGRTIRAEPEAPAAVTTCNRKRPHHVHPPKRKGRIEVMRYNAGGLSTHHYAELLAWLGMLRREGRCPDVIMVQETHWPEDREYSNQDWHVTSTGCSNMHSGVLVMLARRKFQHAVIRKEVPIPGRVLTVRVQQGGMVVYLINVYQKVWNGSHEAKTQRAQVLEAIQKQVHAAPTRYPLVLAGDFNAALPHQPPCTGSAVMRSGNATEAPDVQQLQGILRQFDLRVLNTYHPQPAKHTFTFHNGETSQIDYIIVRARSADRTAKHTTVLTQTRLAQWKTGNVHHPVLASVPCRFWHQPAQARDSAHTRLKQLTTGLAQDADKEQFLAEVSSQLNGLEEWCTERINAVLAAAAERHLLGQVHRREPRQNGLEQPVRHMWQMHRRLAAARQQSAPAQVIQELHDSFKASQKQIRQASRYKRQYFLEEQMQRAELAHRRGDVRTLHLVINRVAPKAHRLRPQIRDARGRMTTPRQELAIIQQYWQGVYTAKCPAHLEHPHQIHIECTEVEAMLSKLPAYKALPSHYTPSIAWKLATGPLAMLLDRTILHSWRQGRIAVLPEWKDAWLALLLKPSKQGKLPSEYRPIGLTDPIGKTLLGTLKKQYGSELYSAIEDLPQFAYATHRGTAQALTRAFQHLHQARALLEAQKLTLSHRKAGARPATLVGAITVSIDLTRAFDSLEPQVMQRALAVSNMPPDVQRLIMEWRRGLQYHVTHSSTAAVYNVAGAYAKAAGSRQASGPCSPRLLCMT